MLCRGKIQRGRYCRDSARTNVSLFDHITARELTGEQPVSRSTRPLTTVAVQFACLRLQALLTCYSSGSPSSQPQPQTDSREQTCLTARHLPFFHQDSHVTFFKAALVFTIALSVAFTFYQYKPFVASQALFPIKSTSVRQPRLCKNEVSRGQQSLPPHNQARKMLLTETSFH